MPHVYTQKQKNGHSTGDNSRNCNKLADCTPKYSKYQLLQKEHTDRRRAEEWQKHASTGTQDKLIHSLFVFSS